ncbi:hypothetical protein [Dyadobacter sp. CY326]|uniref:hypothetical protein n=1 Tax=Dyadobacter sp. CY326 TaxID=2907300 RepID=UPI001F46B8E2|nr:hypothetical protein [Dyadobacter sp. CY326]MCE7065691.1 hypothetical protein [Dyadobacter sp. CY326]
MSRPGLQLQHALLAHVNEISEGDVRKRLSVRNIALLLCFGFYLLIEVVYLFVRFHAQRFDLNLYYNTATRILAGDIPFQDFPLEYPPFALIPIIIPGILSHIFRSNFETYTAWFVIQNIVFGLLSGFFIFKTTVLSKQKAVYKYFILVALALPIFLFRFDPFPAFLTSVFIYYLSRKPVLSGFMLASSIAAKLYTIIFVPIILLFFWVNRAFKPFFSFLMGGFIVVLIMFLAYLLTPGHVLFDFLGYHSSRGIHIESLSGGILLFLNWANLIGLDVLHNYGAFHLATQSSQSVLAAITIVTPLAFIALSALIFKSFQIEKRNRKSISVLWLSKAFVAQLVLFLLLNKVFSPQYLIWLLPVIPFCGKRIFLIFSAIVMLTVIIFPGEYHHLVAKHIGLILILNLRNVLLIWLLIESIANLFPTARRSPRPFTA